MEDDVSARAINRARRIHSYLRDRADRLNEECLMCGRGARESQTRHAYDTPWDEKPETKYFCSDDCRDFHMYHKPWAYFLCTVCEREICEQNPMNGWHVQYRESDGGTVCLRCYQDLILENGLERERLEAGEIPGMFFSYGNLEPIRAGYREVPDFTNYAVNSWQSAWELREKALELMEKGYRVIIGFERLAMGGSQGYVTLMVRR